MAMAMAIAAAGLLHCGLATGADLPVVRRHLDEDFVIRRWDTDTGLGDTTGRSLAQTRDGFLWIGTFNGVSRVDGSTPAVRMSLRDTARASNEMCLTMLGDRAGRLWIGSDGEIVVRDNQAWSRLGPGGGWTGGLVESFAESPAGEVLFGTKGGLFRVGENGIQPLSPALPAGDRDSPWRVVFDSEGRAWARNDQVVLRLDTGGWVTVEDARGTPHRFNGLAASRKGGVWVSDPRGMRRYARGAIEEQRSFPADFDDPLVTILEDREGNTWVGGFFNGLIIQRASGQTQRVTVLEGLAHSHIPSLLEDAEGNIFIGQGAGGVLQLTPRRVRVIHGNYPQSAASRILAVAAAPDGGVYFANGLGEVHRQLGDQSTLVLRTEPGLSVRSLVATRSGELLVGTETRGLLAVRDGTLQPLAPEPFPHRGVQALHEDRQGRLWVGTEGGLAIRTNGRFALFMADTRPELGGVDRFAESPDGTVYWSSWDGVFAYTSNRIEEIRILRAEKDSNVSGLHVDAEGGLWVSFLGGGLTWRRPDGSQATMGEPQGIPAFTLRYPVSDGHGRLWFGSSYGLRALDEAGLKEVGLGLRTKVHPMAFNHQDGLLLDTIRGAGEPASARTPDGRIWFATVRGVAVVTPATLHIHTHPPQVLIREVFTESHTYYGEHDPLNLPPGTRLARVRYTLASFSAPERVRFQHRFGGGSEEWSTPSTERTVEMRGLRPGTYHLEVRGCNSDGIWSSVPATLDLTVQPFLWQTLAFKISLGVLLSGVCGAGLWEVQRRRLRRRQDKLEREEALLGEKARSAAVIGATSDLVLFLDPAQRLVFLNPAGAELLGLAGDAAPPSLQPAEWLTPESADTWQRTVIPESLAHGLWGGALGLKSRLGETIPTTAVVVAHRHSDHSVQFFSAVCRDQRERLRMRQEKQAAETTLQLVGENVGACLAYLDSELRLKWINKDYSALMACPSAALIGRVVPDLLVQAAAPEMAQRLQRALEGQYIRFEWAGLGSEGRMFEVSLVPHRDPDLSLRGVLMVSLDITQARAEEGFRKQLEAQLKQSQKMEALGTLAGGIAHDFNNILTAIAGNTQLAIAEIPPNHPAQGMLADVRQGARRASDLVRQILTFSRREEHPRTPVALAPVLAEATSLLRIGLPANIRLEYRLDPGLPAVLADPTEIHQVVMNLATNAIHAMREAGGTLTIVGSALTVEGTPARNLPRLKPGRYVCLRVTDTGKGMDAETLERIFDPFFTTKPPGEGTGLGLSVVHGILKRLGGEVTVQSVLGKGTSFSLHLPAVEAPVESARPPASPFRRGNGERILLVDDEEPVIFLTQRVLKRLGYECEGFTDPAVALQVFESRPTDFAAVITDLSMPRMTGPELIRRLRRVRGSIPVVLTTGFIRPEDQAAAEQLGVRQLVLKPNTIEEMGRALADALQGAAGVMGK